LINRGEEKLYPRAVFNTFVEVWIVKVSLHLQSIVVCLQ
jgi:hypothetical protein